MKQQSPSKINVVTNGNNKKAQTESMVVDKSNTQIKRSLQNSTQANQVKKRQKVVEATDLVSCISAEMDACYTKPSKKSPIQSPLVFRKPEPVILPKKESRFDKPPEHLIRFYNEQKEHEKMVEAKVAKLNIEVAKLVVETETRKKQNLQRVETSFLRTLYSCDSKNDIHEMRKSSESSSPSTWETSIDKTKVDIDPVGTEIRQRYLEVINNKLSTIGSSSVKMNNKVSKIGPVNAESESTSNSDYNWGRRRGPFGRVIFYNKKSGDTQEFPPARRQGHFDPLEAIEDLIPLSINPSSTKFDNPVVSKVSTIVSDEPSKSTAIITQKCVIRYRKNGVIKAYPSIPPVKPLQPIDDNDKCYDIVAFSGFCQ